MQMHLAMHLDGECACCAVLSPGLGTRMMKTQETLPDCDSKAAPGRVANPDGRLGLRGVCVGGFQEAAAQLTQMETQPGVSIGYKDQDKAEIPRPKYRRHKALGRA